MLLSTIWPYVGAFVVWSETLELLVIYRAAEFDLDVFVYLKLFDGEVSGDIPELQVPWILCSVTIDLSTHYLSVVVHAVSLGIQVI